MMISVLIPTYRRVTSLARCLDALEQQRRIPDEVVVAHRADDEQTKAFLAWRLMGRLRLVVVPVGHANASEARNASLARSSGDLIAMIDDDVVPRPSWLAVVEARFAADASLGVLGGPDWLDGQEVPLADRPRRVGAVQWWGRRIGNHHRGARRPIEVAWLKGANMTFRRIALARAPFGRGLRGQGAQFAEDVAVTLQVKKAGWRLLYDPEAAVDHCPGPLSGLGDHRGLGDPQSLFDAAHNETTAMLAYLSWPRRACFMAWTMVVGTRLLPGVVAALATRPGRWRDSWARARVVRRGRLSGHDTWQHRLRGLAQASAVPVASRASHETVRPYRRRICLVTHVVTPGDGQGRVNYELARHLLRQGHEVTLVASAVAPDLLQFEGLTWCRVRVPSWAPHPVQWAVFAIGAWWKTLGSRDRFDIVHLNGAIAPIRAHVNTSHFVHASALRRMGRGLAGHPLMGWYQRAVTAISSYFERRSYPAAGRVVAVSEGVRRSLTGDLGLPGPQVNVIPLGVDLSLYRPLRIGESWGLRAELDLGRDVFLVLFVGDAKTSRKNLDLALTALTRLGPQYHLAVIGRFDGGPYPQQAQQTGIGDRVHFVGPRRDVASCYRIADAVFCASHYEPASLVLLEAMASGVPVIATPEVGNAVFVEDRANGFLLRSSVDVERAVEILDTLGRDRGLGERIGRAARDSMSSLTWDRMGLRYEQLYLEVGNGELARGAVM